MSCLVINSHSWLVKSDKLILCKKSLKFLCNNQTWQLHPFTFKASHHTQWHHTKGDVTITLFHTCLLFKIHVNLGSINFQSQIDTFPVITTFRSKSNQLNLMEFIYAQIQRKTNIAVDNYCPCGRCVNWFYVRSFNCNLKFSQLGFYYNSNQFN